jgi:hypothetical protein
VQPAGQRADAETIVTAPKMMKQPIATVRSRRHSMRPVSIMNPTTATAITAATAATLPSKVPCTHSSAATSGEELAGSWATV